VAYQLIAALYSCKAPKDDTRTEEWLQALLEAADTDPWRRKIRKAIVARDWEAVKQLVRSVDATTQPPGSLVPLAELIPAKRMHLRLDFWRPCPTATASPVRRGTREVFERQALGQELH
jgi:hypothetical protein